MPNSVWKVIVKSANMLKFLLFGFLCLVGAEIQDKMDELSHHLREEMADVWDMAAVNYSEPVINTTYLASVEFDMRAMGPLYNSTHTVIDVIADKQAYPEGKPLLFDKLSNAAKISKTTNKCSS